jgi:hypothetical protein
MRQVRFDHKDLSVIVRSPAAKLLLDICNVDRDRVGVLFIDGRYVDTLQPGQYAFWKGPADARVVEVDLRETTANVSGQEIMTADKVTLRVNANVTYRIVDARKAVSQADDVRQALYRETQLALRAVIGARELDAFLVGKDTVGEEIEQAVRQRAGELGLEIASVGIRDVILPGEMKDLMNKVTEAKKAAESYIDSLNIKPSTRMHLNLSRRYLVEFFGENKPLGEITPGDADDWRRWLSTKMADNTVRRYCGRAKQFFRAAARKKLIPESPFADMKDCKVTANRDRDYFVTLDETKRVLDACPDAQ